MTTLEKFAGKGMAAQKAIDKLCAVPDQRVQREREIYLLGGELGRLLQNPRKNRKAIQRNLDIAAQLGVTHCLKAEDL
jgi:hypothetical protein